MMRNLTKANLLKYALIALPLAFAGLPIYIHAPDFYAVNFGLSITLIGLLLMVLRVFDAVQDPIIGALSDKFSNHRDKIILMGMILLGGGFWMIFNPLVSLQTTPILIWMGTSILLCTTGFSIVYINVLSLGGLWKCKDEDVSRIMTWREGVGLVGLLLGSILPAVLLSHYGSDEIDDPKKAFSVLTLIFLPILIVCGISFIRWMKNTEFEKPKIDISVSLRDILKINKNAHFYILFLISGFASAIPATLVIFYIRDFLQAEDLTGLFLLLYFLSGAMAMPLWQYIAKEKSAGIGWFSSMILAVAVFSAATFLRPGDVVGYGIISVLAGIAVGGDLALPPTIIAKFIKQNNHQDAASRYYAIAAFISKSALALATGIVLPALAMTGYEPGTISTNLSLPIAYALIPCVVKLFTAILLWQYIKKYKI